MATRLAHGRGAGLLALVLAVVVGTPAAHASGDRTRAGATAKTKKRTKTAKAAGKGKGRASKTRGRSSGKRSARLDRADTRSVAASRPPPVLLRPTGRTIGCPPEMVAVAGQVCVDRWEASLENSATGALLSPHYPPSREVARGIFETWTRAQQEAPAGTLAHEMSVPPPLGLFGPTVLVAVATSKPGAVPHGYLSGIAAGGACAAAGKRLCTESEWVTACRGDKNTAFPYGDQFEDQACNVFREEHPAHVLHGTFSHNHKDPRLNQVVVAGKSLLRKTGETPRCASRWGDDAIWDMVGNLDEWIQDPEGTFVGGFFSRATRAGCSARIAGHPIGYFDYSTGVRCCKDPD